MPAQELTNELPPTIIGMFEILSEHIMEVDPNFKGKHTIRRTINNLYRCKEMYQQKRTKKKICRHRYCNLKK